LEAKEFVKSLRKDANERKMRIENNIKSALDKREHDFEMEKRLEKLKIQEKELQRNSELETRIEEIRRRKEERERKH
jgi:hypothetical protein